MIMSISLALCVQYQQQWLERKIYNKEKSFNSIRIGFRKWATNAVTPQNRAHFFFFIFFISLLLPFWYGFVCRVARGSSTVFSFCRNDLIVCAHIFINKSQCVKMAYLLCRYLKYNRIQAHKCTRERREKKKQTSHEYS